MKNFFAKTTIALVMLSVLTFSCGKPKKGDVPPPENGATTTWTPKDGQKPIVTKSDIKNGDVGVMYSIVPAKPVCVGGTWSLTIVAPPNAQYGAVQNTKKGGDVNFTPLTPGTYKLTLTYKCPCFPDVVIVVTITVS